MKFKRETAIHLAYLLILLMLIAGIKSIVNDRDREIAILREREGLLLTDIKELKHQKSILEEIALKDKRQLQHLQEENEQLRTIRATVTSYSPLDNRSGMCADEDSEVTATGEAPGRQFAAADPSRIPYGTKLYIPQYGEVVVADTGGALRRDKDNLRIDVFADTYFEALEWGVKELEVKILD